MKLRYVLRKLARTPLFTASAPIRRFFTVVNGVLLKPLPFDDPEALVGAWHTAPGLGFDEVNQSPATYFTYREESRTFEDIGMWDNTQVSITGLEEPEEVEAMRVTDGTFPILRGQAEIGRVFTREDDSPGTPETVILGHGYWQARFGGEADVLGKMLRVDGKPKEIIGVMPANLRFLRFDPAVYLSYQWDRAEVFMGNFSYQALARLKPGATVEQANADVARMIPMTVEKFPKGITLANLREARVGPLVRPLKEDVVGDIGNVALVTAGNGGSGPSRRVCQRGEPLSGSGRRPAARAGCSHGLGGGPTPAGSRVAAREHHARHPRWSRGVGGRLRRDPTLSCHGRG